MIVFKILYDEVCVGIVVSQDGTLTPDEAKQIWNEANPSYAGDSAIPAEFILR